MSHEEIEELFHGAGENSRGCVSTDSLANLLQQYQLQGGLFKIIKRYAVCCLLGSPSQLPVSFPLDLSWLHVLFQYQCIPCTTRQTTKHSSIVRGLVRG